MIENFGCLTWAKSTHSTPRAEARGMPFDKLKAPSSTEGLSLPAGRQGLILSGAFYPDLKIGVCLRPELRPRVRRRTYQESHEAIRRFRMNEGISFLEMFFPC
jgi:hypothetical protein